MLLIGNHPSHTHRNTHRHKQHERDGLWDAYDVEEGIEEHEGESHLGSGSSGDGSSVVSGEVGVSDAVCPWWQEYKRYGGGCWGD